MMWDKSPFAKQKEEEKQKIVVADNELGGNVCRFLMGQHNGRIQFPDSKLYIGTAYEVDGVSEDWGYVVKYQQPDGTLKPIAEGRDLQTTLDNATKEFRKELENGTN